MLKGNLQAATEIFPDFLRAAKDEIDTLDLRQTRYMLCHGKPRGLGWPEAKADLAIVEYKRFLRLKLKHRSARIVPTKLVDQVWHQHILDTRKYEIDCRKIFGGTLHHNPYLGLQGDSDVWEASFEETCALYAKEFNAAPSRLTGVAGCDAADIRAAGCDAADIRPAGCDAADIGPSGCDAADIRAAGCDAADIEPSGCDAADIYAAGCDAADIKVIGSKPGYFLATVKFDLGVSVGR